MKNLFSSLVLFCCFMITLNAQTTTPVQHNESMSAPVQVAVETPNNDADLLALSTGQTNDAPKSAFEYAVDKAKQNRSDKGKDWPTFKEKPWYYIGAGVFIAVVVVLYVVTGGEGYSSR